MILFCKHQLKKQKGKDLVTKKYEKEKEKTLEDLSRPFLNIVTYEALLKNDLFDYYLHCKGSVAKGKEDLKMLPYSKILMLKNEETEVILRNLKKNNMRCKELSENIYKKSKLSNFISYSEISMDLMVAIKSVFILSASKANPSKLMEMRLNTILSLWIDEFKRRTDSTENLCKKAIYLSILCPDFLEKQNRVIVNAIERTKGGAELSSKIKAQINEIDFDKVYFPSALKLASWIKAKQRWKELKSGG